MGSDWSICHLSHNIYQTSSTKVVHRKNLWLNRAENHFSWGCFEPIFIEIDAVTLAIDEFKVLWIHHNGFHQPLAMKIDFLFSCFNFTICGWWLMSQTLLPFSCQRSNVPFNQRTIVNRIFSVHFIIAGSISLVHHPRIMWKFNCFNFLTYVNLTNDHEWKFIGLLTIYTKSQIAVKF